MIALEMLEVWKRNSLDDTSCNVQHEKWKEQSAASSEAHTGTRLERSKDVTSARNS